LVDTCYTGVENCANSLSVYTGSESRILDLKNQLQSAKKITSDNQYRNLLIASKFYEQSMYRATSKILQEILLERPDYIEVKKMLGFSLFELGKYEEAKKYILEYLDKNPRDLDSIVSLGELYFFLGDYVSSNLYLNNAIMAGYLPKTNLERRLAYNYSLLGDVVGMMKVLSYLLESEEATEDDFAVGISAAINEGEYDRAVRWAKR
jgi:tetratricopeptide (TPR) repeat protein